MLGMVDVSSWGLLCLERHFRLEALVDVSSVSSHALQVPEQRVAPDAGSPGSPR